MSAGAGRARWQMIEPGLYGDPSGRWQARRLDHASWRLEGPGQVRGPFSSLADCREIAGRLQQPERGLVFDRPALSVHQRLAYVITSEFALALDPAEMDELFALARDAAVDGGFAASLSLEEARAIVTACLPRLER